MIEKTDEYWMAQAIKEAQHAFTEDEVPIGAVIVSDHKIIAKGYNQVERLCDVTAHAEMIAITAAANYLGAKFLEDCSLYVTVEPCPMCAAALRWARIGKIVYAAADPKSGYSRFDNQLLHPKTEIKAAVSEEICSEMMSLFFKGKRMG